jgi:isopentenyl-diphosphate delta-isomerase
MVGSFENSPIINPEEVESWKWMSMEDVKSDINFNPSLYTEWFKIIFKNFYKHINITDESNSK